jgi:hypothetical protein
MTRNRPLAARSRLWALATAIFATPLLCTQAPEATNRPAREAITPECRPPLARILLRGHGKLVSPVEEASACTRTLYEGPQTALYSDRPYRTTTRVEPLVGHVFCQAPRHGTQSWTVEISHPTQLLTLGNEGHRLEDMGWRRLDESVLVEAAGVPFDALYAKRFEPGRYLIRQDFSRTPPPVFWRSEHAHIVR